MDEITFGDILLHYTQKLKEVFEDVEDIKRHMAISIDTVESSWKGNAGNTCRIKLEELNINYSKVVNELSDSITKLLGLTEGLAEMEIQTQESIKK